MNGPKTWKGLGNKQHISVGRNGKLLLAKKEKASPKHSMFKTSAPVSATTNCRANNLPWPENACEISCQATDSVTRRKRTTPATLPGFEEPINEIACGLNEKTVPFSRQSSTDEELCLSECDTPQSRCNGFEILDNDLFEINIEDIEREVSKRVISGMMLTSRCGRKIENISQKHLTKKIGTFLRKPLPISVTSPEPTVRFPSVVTPSVESTHAQRDNVYSERLNIVYPSKERKCRYIRAPLSPIPSVDWVFESCQINAGERPIPTSRNVNFPTI